MNGRRVAAVAWVAAVFALVAGVGPAQAHESLRSTSPAEGAWVAVRPAEVSLSFVTAPGRLGAAAAVTGPDGSSVAAGPARVDGDRLVVPLVPAGDAGGRGAYTVVWRVTSADGHPLSGRFSFGVGEPGSAPLPRPAGATGAGAGGTTGAASSGGARLVVWAAAGAGVVAIVLLLALRMVLARRAEGGAGEGVRVEG